MDTNVASIGGRPEMDHVMGRLDRRIRLRDGRWLGFAEYGDPQGTPLFAFHGTPGSRLMALAAHLPAQASGVRLVAPDRPGFGLSSRRAGRRIGDWPDDVAELADALGIGRFGVVGVSGGGPYALACAWRMPARLSMVGSVSGLAPLGMARGRPRLPGQDHAALELIRFAPWLGRSLMTLGGLAWQRFPVRMHQRLVALCPPADRAVLEQPAVARSLTMGLQEAFRGGSGGAAEELRLFVRPWGFALQEITVPVHIWHGARDKLVPCAAAKRLAAALPDCRLEIIADGGHYLVYALMDRLLGVLRREVEARPPAAAGD